MDPLGQKQDSLCAPIPGRDTAPAFCGSTAKAVLSKIFNRFLFIKAVLMNDIIPEYTKADYLQSTAPFEWLYQFKDNKLKMRQMSTILSERARKTGVRNFASLFKLYLETVNSKDGGTGDNTTDFEGQEIELDCGKWIADDFGVTGTDKMGFEIVACNHPIMPVQRLINVDSGIEKIKLAYRKNKQWRTIVADKKTLASNNAIIQLADYGIAVNSENSKHLVRYLTDIEHLNYEKIEELNSVGRLGWIEDYGFSPYVDDLVFDGDLSFKHFFESVKCKGTYQSWLETANQARKNSTIVRLIVAASFGSVLVRPCDALPFFVHLWGGSEAGKTVGLMLAASIWANPAMGEYIHTFNSTAVGQELSAAFVNSLPLIIDELQIIGDKKDFDKLIYTLSEGVGRSRGAKSGGLQKVSSWQNCMLTTGEQPISNGSSASGAINRIIEIDCKEIRLFQNPVEVVSEIKKNYGFAGKQFVERLQYSENMKYAIDIQKNYYKQLCQGQSTDKQAMAASIILAADFLTEKWIFKDGLVLDVQDIEPYLYTKKQVSANERALEFIYDFVSINLNKFSTNAFHEYAGEIWGCMDDDYIYIIKSQFDKIMHEEGYNPTAFLSWAKDHEYIDGSQDRTTKAKRIQGTVCRCVWIKKMNETKTASDVEVDDLPL
ncbi:MAG: DUF927 domain-containing protein [Clostridiales bacterium]|nr:DUF927 domain-containing protein [Clostridiales bacterium]